VKKRPLLTILIPTRGRSESLYFSVAGTKQLLYSGEVEVIIVSNGDSMEDDLKSLDSRTLQLVRVVRSSRRLGMAENWRFALEHATGTWFTVLGDDDLIASSILDQFLQALSLYSTTSINGIKTVVSTFVWEYKDAKLVPGAYQVQSSDTSHEEVSIDRDLSIFDILPQRYPTGSTGSFLRTDWARSLGPSVMYQSVSPDWYTGYLFFALNESFICFNGQVVSCGKHPLSSITQMKLGGKAYLNEINLNKGIGNVTVESRYVSGFPTTWLSKVDSLLQACKALRITNVPTWKVLVRSSYDTTPRFVYKVYRAQQQAFPEFGVLHHLWFCKFQALSLMKIATRKL
jgi:glycosyltransferase involved in cell wall biosynthesis